MTVRGDLLHMLETVAEALGDDLRDKLVFVGGCTTALLLTDPITSEDVRATTDVDLIVGLAGYGGWARLQEHLRGRGFSESSEDDVMCRMRLGDLKVDFMPDDDKILGFSNRWYAEGIRTAVTRVLPGGREIRCLTPPLFLATKLEAYLGRGNDDPLGSHDLEDILLVVDGREELAGEVRDADREIRSFIGEQLRLLRAHPDFEHFLHGNIKGPTGRVEIIEERLDALTVDEGS
jgi:predicted nucleotidyltransferase